MRTTDAIGAWPFEDIPAKLVAALFKCSPGEAEARLATIRARHDDAAWLADYLMKVPAPALAILAMLVEHGGPMEVEELLDAVASRFGIDEPETRPGIGALLSELLIVPLTTRWGGEALGVVATVADGIAARVAELDAPVLPGDAFAARDGHDGGRTLLAVCHALARVDVKRTQTGLAHRGGVKRLAKQLGVAERTVDAVVASAIGAGLVGVTPDDVLRPERARLLDAARGVYAHEPALVALAAELAKRPLALDRVRRWLRHAGSPVLAESLGWLPGLCRGTVGGVDAIRLDPAAGEPATSVTPSFEVFVPPEARREDVCHALACAELARVDRVIVARITKGSVASAVAAGATGDELLARLAGACRTPIPQNGELAIREWAAEGAQATIASGRVVVVPPAAEARVRAALGVDARVLAPGVLLVADDVSEAAIAAALGKLGIHATRHAATTTMRATMPAALGPLGGDDRLRARVAAYRAGSREERVRVAPRAKAPSDEALDHWQAKYGELPVDLLGAVDVLLSMISAHDVRFLLSATTIDELARRAGTLMRKQRGRSGGGQRELEVVADTSSEPPDAGVAWQRDHVHARLEAAARTHASMLLDVDGGRVTLAVSRVIRRGTALLVLGEGPDGERVAVPLSAIRGVADAAPPAPRWRPVPGQGEPSGHEPCPCGSGQRYRSCCRPEHAVD